MQDWDAFLNDQVQNALAFYTTVTAPQAVAPQPTVVQLRSPAPFTQTLGLDPASGGSMTNLLLIAGVVLGVVLLLRK